MSSIGVSECCDNVASGSSNRATVELPLIIKVKYPENSRSWNIASIRNRRVLDKQGKPNVHISEIPSKRVRYIKDLGNTLINIRWRWILLSLCLANGVAWIVFALIWMGLALHNDDINKSDVDSCVIGTHNFAGYLLLSIETLTTIGFGVIYPGDCHEAWVVLTLQVLTGVAIEGALVTAVYVKMSRPVKRPDRLFSRNAIVCLRDDNLCLVFRMYDRERRYCTKTEIRAFLLRKNSSSEGEQMDNFMQKLKLENYGLTLWPVEIVHVIAPGSPLWKISADKLMTTRLELMVVIQGDSITTGQPSENRRSYTNSEILWGRRFINCIEYEESKEKYVLHEDKINTTIPFDTPLCSAYDFAKLKNELSA